MKTLLQRADICQILHMVVFYFCYNLRATCGRPIFADFSDEAVLGVWSGHAFTTACWTHLSMMLGCD